jgi:hypothetical protein
MRFTLPTLSAGVLLACYARHARRSQESQAHPPTGRHRRLPPRPSRYPRFIGMVGIPAHSDGAGARLRLPR